MDIDMRKTNENDVLQMFLNGKEIKNPVSVTNKKETRCPCCGNWATK